MEWDDSVDPDASLAFEPLTIKEVDWLHARLIDAREFARCDASDNRDGDPTLVALDRAFAAYLANEVDPDGANAVVLAIGVAFGAELVARSQTSVM